MKTNPIGRSVVTENYKSPGTVTWELVRQRAVELALIDGRSVPERVPAPNRQTNKA